jgi:hypothetical protein
MLLAAGYETTVAIANLVLFADATTDEHADGIPAWNWQSRSRSSWSGFPGFTGTVPSLWLVPMASSTRWGGCPLALRPWRRF